MHATAVLAGLLISFRPVAHRPGNGLRAEDLPSVPQSPAVPSRTASDHVSRRRATAELFRRRNRRDLLLAQANERGGRPMSRRAPPQGTVLRIDPDADWHTYGRVLARPGSVAVYDFRRANKLGPADLSEITRAPVMFVAPGPGDRIGMGGRACRGANPRPLRRTAKPLGQRSGCTTTMESRPPLGKRPAESVQLINDLLRSFPQFEELRVLGLHPVQRLPRQRRKIAG